MRIRRTLLITALASAVLMSLVVVRRQYLDVTVTLTPDGCTTLAAYSDVRPQLRDKPGGGCTLAHVDIAWQSVLDPHMLQFEAPDGSYAIAVQHSLVEDVK